MTPTSAPITKDPAALYAGALGALHLSPEVRAVLSPVGAELFRTVYSAAVAAGGEAVGEIGAAALEGAIAAVGPAVLQEVSSVATAVVGAVGEAIPFVNIFVSILEILSNPAFAATGSNSSEVDCLTFWALQPGNSGPSDPVTGVTATTPADIFASAEAGSPYTNSALGNSLIAITDAMGPGDGVWLDAPVDVGPHTIEGLSYLTAMFKNMFPDSPHVGIPASHRPIYRALRTAIGSNGPDHGAIPYAFFMDLLAGDFDAGRLTTKYIAFLLYNWIDYSYGGPSNSIAVPIRRQSLCPGSAAQAMAAQIVALIGAWKKTRTEIRPAKVRPGPFLGFAFPGLFRPTSPAATAIRHGWSPSLDKKISAALTFVLLLERYRAELARKADRSPTQLAHLIHLL